VENYKLRYFNSFEFFDHAPFHQIVASVHNPFAVTKPTDVREICSNEIELLFVFPRTRHERMVGPGSGPRLMNSSPKTQQLFFYFDLVHVFGVRFDKPWPTCYRGFHFLTKRTQVCAYAEVRQRPGQNSLAFLPYHAHTCWDFASSRPPTL